MAKSSADQKIEADEAQLNQDVAAVEATEAPAPDAPATDPATPAEAPAPADAPADVPADTPADPAPADAPADPAPATDAQDQAVAADEAQLATDEAADVAADATDPTPEQEAAPQVSNGPGQIDGSGILQQTNQEVIDNLPKNDNGQVVIDENGSVVGLDNGSQPTQPSGSQA